MSRGWRLVRKEGYDRRNNMVLLLTQAVVLRWKVLTARLSHRYSLFRHHCSTIDFHPKDSS